MVKNIFFIMTLIFVGLCHSQQVIWSTPQNISLSGHHSGSAQVVVNENRIAVAVWKSQIAGHDVIRESHSTDGGASWSPPRN